MTCPKCECHVCVVSTAPGEYDRLRTRAEEAEARCEYGQWREQYESAVAATARAEQAEAQLAEAREVLRSVEWGGPYGGGSNCPSCANDLGNDHAPDCRLAKVLSDSPSP